MGISLAKVQQTAPGLAPVVRTARLSLMKNNLLAHVARVACMIDVSGSFQDEWQDGLVQKLMERALALGLTFDDNGEVDMFTFGAQARYEKSVNMAAYQTWATDWMRNNRFEGVTRYAAALTAVNDYYFGAPGTTGGGFFKKLLGTAATAPVGPIVPIFLMFITDGDNSDKPETNKLILESAKRGIFIQFMAIGQDNQFPYLKTLDNLPGRELDNTGFFAVTAKDILNNTFSDAQLFDNLTQQYGLWVPQAQAKQLVTA